MAKTLVCDTDFLSSFIKIDRMHLIKDFYQVDRVLITHGVYDELAEADLTSWVDKTDWIQEELVDRREAEQLRMRAALTSIIGISESEAIVLAKTLPDALLLINDKTARRVAAQEGIQGVDIVGFLQACKDTGFLDTDQIAKIIADLDEKDYYKFADHTKERLLQRP